MLCRLQGWVLYLCVFWQVVIPVHAQGLPGRDELFAPLQESMTQARSERAELLAPVSYARASESLVELEKYFAGKPKADRLLKDQAAVQQAISKTRQIAAQSSKTLSSVIKAYDDALVAGAVQSQGEVWKKAQQRFQQAVARVESDDLESARSKGAEAEVLLRDAELQAIKASVLGVARDWISKAQVARAPELAPRTFTAAQQQLSLADQQLIRNRYELDEPKRLAAQAGYEARHAIYLAGMVERAQGKDGLKQQLAEEQWLALEQPVRELAGALEVPEAFDKGMLPVLQQVQDKVKLQQNQLLSSRNVMHDREQEITELKGTISELNAAITKLESRLGSESEARQALLKRLSGQERMRENISKIESMFSADEGRVYRQGNQLVMSLNAISFRSGKSNIAPESFPLLAKVGEALRLFPNASLSVEGHTDSAGSDSANLLLSQDRADAVRQYLISNLGISVEKVGSVGYGESRPIASNETEAGRARNRRIEVVMNLDVTG